MYFIACYVYQVWLFMKGEGFYYKNLYLIPIIAVNTIKSSLNCVFRVQPGKY